MRHLIGTIINYCSNEFRFLEHSIKEAEKFSKQIIITVSDHFFDGSKENVDELYYIFNRFPNCIFLYYPYVIPMVPKRLFQKIGDNFCCTFSRLLGFSYISKKIEYVLFLDADEIVESEKFLKFLDNFNYQNFDALKLCNYWYFREAKYQANTFEDSCVLAKRKALSRKTLLQKGDRFAAFENVKGKTIAMLKGIDNKPFIHHYSWVRTKSEMLKKVSTWGHKNERNWSQLVEKEFKSKFSGKDFVHGYSFKTIKSLFEIDLDLEPKMGKKKDYKNVKKITSRTINKILGKNIWRFFPLKAFLKRLD